MSRCSLNFAICYFSRCRLHVYMARHWYTVQRSKHIDKAAALMVPLIICIYGSTGSIRILFTDHFRSPVRATGHMCMCASIYVSVR